MTMNIRKKLTEIAVKQGLSVGFDDTKRVALTVGQKARVREEVENSVNATYRGTPMPMTQGETPSGMARVSVGVLRKMISKSELDPKKLENAFSDIANGTAMAPCIRCDKLEDAVVIEQGRHRITAMHDLGYGDAIVNYPADQEERLQALLGNDFTPLQAKGPSKSHY